MSERIKTETDALVRYMTQLFSIEPSASESYDYIRGFYESQSETAVAMVHRLRRIVYEEMEKKR